MLPARQSLFLLSVALLTCDAERRLTVVHLANGGTSRPLMVGPLEHDHSPLMPNDPLPLNAAPPSEASTTASEVTASESSAPTSTTTTTTTSTSTTTTTTTAAATTTTTTSTSTKISTIETSSATSRQPQSSQLTTTTTAATALPPPCHQSCLGALNSTHLTPDDDALLTAGSSLTLTCEMTLVPDLILEELLWLFHPGGSPEGRCSLTPHETLHSCSGFPALLETDHNNGTFLRQVLTLSSLGANHTGEYMCQIRVTCCPASNQHLMSQRQEVQVRITVWWSDYTVQLAATGAVAAVLVLALVAVSLYGWRQGRTAGRYEKQAEVEVPSVLHLPLIDDKDEDSFESSDEGD